MNGHSEGLRELETLLAARTQRELTDTEKHRLNELIRDDADAIDLVLRDLEIEAGLRWEFGQVAPAPVKPAGEVARVKRWWLKVAASATVVCGICLLVAIAVRNPPMDHDREVERVPDGAGEPVVDGNAGWDIRPTTGARFEFRSPDEIALNAGELHVTRKHGQQELRIVTPHGVVTSSQSQFVVGLYGPQVYGDITVKPLVRVLVLTGLVSLTNSLGEVRGDEGVVLQARSDQKPVKTAVNANSAFAWDLYRVLARRDEDRNLFMSPFSISGALAMAAEGARGETADEFATVMHLPDELRRVGVQAQQLPFQAAQYHTGMAQIQRALDQADTPEKQEIRDRLAKLRSELTAANRSIALANTLPFLNAGKAYQRARRLADEINRLQTEVDQYRLTIANALWVDATYPLADAYVESLNGFYKTGAAFPVDFRRSPDAALAEINDWVNKKTEGMLPEALGPRAITTQTKLVLTNAIFFMGQWHEPFQESRTKTAPFHLADGQTQDVKLMRVYSRQGRYAAFHGDGTLFPTPEKVPVRIGRQRDAAGDFQPYPDEQGFRLLELPYKGGRIAMYVLAPESADGLGRIEALVNAERFENWVGELKSYGSIRVDLPRFTMDADYSLESILPELGLKRAFQRPGGGQGADFSGISASDDASDQLWISRVLHKARIEVNEEGTKAAAVTSIAKDASAVAVEMVPFNPQFKADRPFLFVIRDKETGCLLFVGRHLKPR